MLKDSQDIQSHHISEDVQYRMTDSGERNLKYPTTIYRGH